MREVTVAKESLLKTLITNKKEHESIYEDAVKGYRSECIECLTKALEAVKAGDDINLYFGLSEPVNYSDHYDLAIKMLNMSLDKDITLSQHEFQQYILDDWDWKGKFLMDNSAYTVRAQV